MARLFPAHRAIAVLSAVAVAGLLLVGSASSAPSSSGFAGALPALAEGRDAVHWVGTWASSPHARGLAINEWIRASGRFDAVIDFDAAVRDPANPAFSQARWQPMR
jgi:hypothetical protein